MTADPDLARVVSVGDALAAGLARTAGELAAAAVAVRDGDEPEAVRALRIACRRARAALALTGDVTPAAGRLRDQLRDLAHAASAARDLDVQIAALTRMVAVLAADERAGVDGAVAMLRQQQADARARLRATLAEHSVPAVAAGLAALAGRVVALDPDRIRAVTGRRLRRSNRRVRAAGADLTAAAASADGLHRLRIAVKRLRYELEFVAAIQASAARLTRRLTRLQDLLGAHHDAQVGVATLAALAADPGLGLDGRAGFGLGILAERARSAAAQAVRAELAPRYRQVRGRRWRDVARDLGHR